MKRKKKNFLPCGVNLPVILNFLADRLAKKDKIRLYLGFIRIFHHRYLQRGWQID